VVPDHVGGEASSLMLVAALAVRFQLHLKLRMFSSLHHYLLAIPCRSSSNFNPVLLHQAFQWRHRHERCFRRRKKSFVNDS
jgi:hypothetical protein